MGGNKIPREASKQASKQACGLVFVNRSLSTTTNISEEVNAEEEEEEEKESVIVNKRDQTTTQSTHIPNTHRHTGR